MATAMASSLLSYRSLRSTQVRLPSHASHVVMYHLPLVRRRIARFGAEIARVSTRIAPLPGRITHSYRESIVYFPLCAMRWAMAAEMMASVSMAGASGSDFERFC